MPGGIGLIHPGDVFIPRCKEVTADRKLTATFQWFDGKIRTSLEPREVLKVLSPDSHGVKRAVGQGLITRRTYRGVMLTRLSNTDGFRTADGGVWSIDYWLMSKHEWEMMKSEILSLYEKSLEDRINARASLVGLSAGQWVLKAIEHSLSLPYDPFTSR
jgi:hypothetical protein